MRIKEKIISFIPRAGMELSWFYAWAGFMSEAILGQAFPFLQATAVFLLAACAAQTRFLPGRSRYRFLWEHALRGVGLGGSALILAYPFAGGRHPFFSLWAAEVFIHRQGFSEWLGSGVVVCFILFFWLGGSSVGRLPDDPARPVRRFDLGLAAFLLLCLIKLLLAAKLGMQVREPYGEILIFPFFIFSLLAMGGSDRQGHAARAFLHGYRGTGLILGFSIVVLGVGAAAAVLFLPCLQQAAASVTAGLQTAAGPLEPMFAALLRFLFAPRGVRQERPPQNAPEEAFTGHPSPHAGWPASLHQLMAWTFIGLLLLLVLVGLGLVIWLFARLLWLRVKRMQPGEDAPPSWGGMLRQIRSQLIRLYRRVHESFYGYSSAARLLGAVTRWGRRSGVHRPPAATPLEYGRRLAAVFPHLRSEVETIVEAYHLEVYRQTPLSGGHLKAAQGAWRTLRSPRQWRQRLKSAVRGQSPRSA